jgi:glutamyl-Q tRNA(Asp) synthetase
MTAKSPEKTHYRGRFAPSPTGPLHFGSLVAALGSYLQARSQQGEWLVRMEDLDPPREQAGAADDILRTLEAYHLHWDGAVLYQSQRHEAYADALADLAKSNHTFACGCSRKTIAEVTARLGLHTYPGTCREGLPPGVKARATRLRVPAEIICFDDDLQGTVSTPLDQEIGDFVVKRADGLYAYHLAVVVDDAYQGITEIVRGSDLLGATAPQRYLQRLLGYPSPRYIHLPVATNAEGEKLSKQTFAKPLDPALAGPTLARALTFLGHDPGPDMARESAETLLAWAVAQWDLAKVPRCAKIAL